MMETGVPVANTAVHPSGLFSYVENIKRFVIVRGECFVQGKGR